MTRGAPVHGVVNWAAKLAICGETLAEANGATSEAEAIVVSALQWSPAEVATGRRDADAAAGVKVMVVAGGAFSAAVATDCADA